MHLVSIPARMRHHLVAIATLLLVPWLPSPARADHPPIVLESYVGDKPADAEAILSPLVEELAKNKFVIGAAVVGRKFETTASRPAVTGGLPGGFGEAVTRGYDLWTNGKFDEAAEILGRLIEVARASSGEFAKNQNALQPQLQKALIALALSQLKQGDRGAAKQTMAEVLRGDPNVKITRGMYGQDAAELYGEVLRELNERGRGTLIVTVDATAPGIYVNERLVEMGSGLELSLFPGEYRVVARIGNEVTRAHRVVVVGGGTHRLTIDPDFDRAVHTGPGWTGFRFAKAAERDREELRYGAAFATAIDARQVIVVGIDTVRGRRMIRGALVNKVNGRDLRSASIPLDANPSPDQRRNLARFLNGGPATPDLIVGVSAGGDEAGRSDGPAARPLWGGWKWVAGGAALAAGIAGGVLLAYDGKCSKDVAAPPCPDHYENTAQGWLTVGGAVALAGVTAYLFVRERRAGAGAGRTAYVVPAAGGAIAGYAARF
jgi:hypothetical protein